MEAPLQVAPLFRPLDEALLSLLASLQPDDWNKQTSARLWTVKDVAAHLLDGNLRTLSIQRDRYFGETPPSINGYADLVAWLNQLNADWVKASKRLSPEVLSLLHRTTGPLTCTYYESLDLWEESIFPVDWAGETKSYNWMHLAREFTEKWHHQQQIRDAAGRPGLFEARFFHPVMDTFLRALPHTFRDVEAAAGTVVHVAIRGTGTWRLTKQPTGWALGSQADEAPGAEVELPPDIAWKLFCKNVRPADVIHNVVLKGNEGLSRRVLDLVAVMA